MHHRYMLIGTKLGCSCGALICNQMLHLPEVPIDEEVALLCRPKPISQGSEDRCLRAYLLEILLHSSLS